jgi:hypothetical protein
MAAQLAAILEGGLFDDPGQDKRGELLANGSFVHRAADGEITATEAWRLFRREQGHSLYSRVLAEGEVVDLWMITDEQRNPSFLEVTRRRDSMRSRMRFYIRENSIRVVQRGGESGILKQALPFQGDLLCTTPSAVIDGWLAGRTLLQTGDCLVVDRLGGRLVQVGEMERDEGISITAVGRRSARYCKMEANQWWLDAATGIPLEMKGADGTAELTEWHWSGQP